MKGFIYIDDDNIGEVNFSITDESMGGIGGSLVANEKYKKYQQAIQKHFENYGISNMNHFNFRIILDDKTELQLQGGIGVSDPANFDEIYVESAGLDLSNFQK